LRYFRADRKRRREAATADRRFMLVTDADTLRPCASRRGAPGVEIVDLATDHGFLCP